MNKALLKYFLYCITFLCAFSASAENIKSIGVPYIQNYPKSIYLSGNQNWSIAKDKSGIMYFGNTEGLLSYDGKYWQQYKMPNKQIVRSVTSDADGIIYTGSFGEFGYWKVTDKKLKYHSLVQLIPKQHKVA